MADRQPVLRGRQAEAERNDRLVLEAARSVVARCGADATVAAIAQEAGVGMGSLYRRYGTKDDLLRHVCTLAMQETVQAAEEALAVPDAWSGLAQYVRSGVDRGTGTLGALAGSIETTPGMWELSKRSRTLLARLVRRAQDAGALRDDVSALDIAWLIETLGRSGPAARAAEDGVIRQRLTELAIDGLRARPRGSGSRLPRPPPTASHYERRWHAPAGQVR